MFSNDRIVLDLLHVVQGDDVEDTGGDEDIDLMAVTWKPSLRTHGAQIGSHSEMIMRAPEP